MSRTVVVSCLIFALFLLLFPTNPIAMFTDPDTGWHLAAGDLIRASGAIPAHDPWSFTAGTYPWLNIAWGWDIAVSYLYEHFGWHGVIAFNSITIAATLTVLFTTAMIRTQHGIAAFITTLLAITQFNVNIRPYQITFLLTALLMLILMQVTRRRCSVRWLMALPLFMPLWVNTHGGYIAAFFLLGVHGLDALLKKDWPMARWLAVAGLASMAACLINPYGIHILSVTADVLFDVAKPIIDEWRPLSFGPYFFIYHIYLVLFIALVMMRPLPVLRHEKWIAYSWLFLATASIRHLNVFIIVSAPLLALGIREILLRKNPEPPAIHPLVQKLAAGTNRIAGSRAGACTALAVCAALVAWLFTPQAMRLYQTASFNPMPDLSGEIAYAENHYPQARLLTHYNLGGALIFYTRGKIPVFIDGRTQTAYPAEVLRDYMDFVAAGKNWPEILDRYRIDGAMIFNDDKNMTDRFISRKGWHLAFEGPTATLFMRDKP